MSQDTLAGRQSGHRAGLALSPAGVLNADAAVARIAAVAAGCLLIGERLGLGPPRIEFERARLYAVDPAGFGAMAVASTVSILAFPRLSGTCAEAVSTFIAAGLAPVL